MGRRNKGSQPPEMLSVKKEMIGLFAVVAQCLEKAWKPSLCHH